ncbi:MAG: hypothetical protein GY862_19960 [Gammaproteobacteria bacterium]|nr:hypothetical protein [Gammaproteobacteria bacterium]
MATTAQKASKLMNQRIIINSIGNAGAGLLAALKHISPLPKTKLARLLYQAPAELVRGLPADTATEMNALLRSTGVDSVVISEQDDFVPGDAEHEIALVVKEMRYMSAVVQLVVDILGVNSETAQKMLCTSPAVLIGKVSKSTVAALQQRFKALRVDLDVSRPDAALFDLFIAERSSAKRQRVQAILNEFAIPAPKNGEQAGQQALLAAGLSKSEADTLWDRLRQLRVPLRIVNRDFERFDLRLDEAPDNPAMRDFLVSTTAMPEAVAAKAVKRTPVVIQQNIRFSELETHLAAIDALGGRASGHLLLFQKFALLMEKVKDPEQSSRLLQVLGGLSPQQALETIRGKQAVHYVFTNPQARWLQWELRQIGTDARMVLQ